MAGIYLLDTRRRPGWKALLWAPFALLVLLFSPPSTPASDVAERKTVVLLYPDARLLPEPLAVEQAIRSTLEPAVEAGIDFYTEYLDLSLLSEDRSERQLIRFLRQKYKDRKIDLIIPVAFPTLRFFLKHRADLFPGAPAIFSAANLDGVTGLQLGPDITGVRLGSQWGATLEAALRLHPGTRRVMVVTGTSAIDRNLQAAAAEDLGRYRDRVEFTYLNGWPMGRLLGEVAGLPTDSIVLFVSLLRDGAGRPFTDPDAVSLIARASSVPVYSWSETHLGRGIVGGRLASFAAQGARAGELGLRILRGEKPENLPIVDGGGTAYMFDERQLRRWRISESRLPSGSIVRYQEGSLWALYGSYVVGGAVLILIQALLITGLLLQRTGRKRAELSLGERLRFESIVAEVSASLIHVPLSEWDAELERGLQRVAEFLGVDRASLQEYRPDGVIVRISWAVEGVERLSRIVEAGQFPWTTAQLRQRRVIRFSRLDELPEEAVIDRQGYQNVGTRSCLSLPVSDGEIMLGVLSFHSIRNERSWPDEFVERLQLLGEVFAGALGRRAAELLLNERLRFEALLSEQTAVLSSRLPADVDQQIRRGLRQIADFFEVDRGSLTEFSQDRRTARVTHSWVAEGVEPAPPAIGLDELPWVVAKLQDGEVVRFSRVEELPAAEAAVDRATYLRLGIQSRLEVPLMVGGKVVGALAFSTVRAERAWKDELVQRLRLLGEVFANVLSRRQAEVDAQRLRHDLAHVGRVSTIGELTASLAHELTQPLTAILSNAQAALRHLASDPGNLEEMRAILEDIVADDKRAGEVIRRLRGLLKKGDREFAVLDLNETVGEVARLVAADAVLRNVSLALDMTRELPPVWGDRVQLQQVVLNLILNGLDAIRESGRADRSLLIRTSKDGAATVRVAVRDSGVGIDQADLERIFQPFYSTKAEGMGMGLAISRSIVEAHGGRLEAANNPDGGATFSFTLPVSQEEQ